MGTTTTTDPYQRPEEPDDGFAEAIAGAQSLADLAGLLRALRRRHARRRRDSSLTYRELAEKTGWSRAAIAEYFTARTLPPTDRFDALLEVLGAARGERRALADARDRVEENRRGERPAAVPVRQSPRQLPADTALFTGRDRELLALFALAEQAHEGGAPGTVVISAIDGMGGVGKTALAVRAAHRLADRFPDGQLFLDLRGRAPGSVPREPAEALHALLSGLGLPPQTIPADLDARAALYRDRLAGTRTLVVLDNAAGEAQVRPLLPASETCLVLVTSRRRLKSLDDAMPLPLDVLPIEQAAALLRAAARLDDSPRDEPLLEQVAELCGRLPLALMIAGAILRTGREAWSLPMLIDRLAERPPGDELAGYTDDTRSLQAVFDLSYRAIPADMQVLFRRVGLLPGPQIDAHAAAALLDSDPHTADRLLGRLADHNLLEPAAPGRYRTHDLIRAHASTVAVIVDTQSDREAALDRLLHYYGYTARTASLLITRQPRIAPSTPAPPHTPAFPDPQTARAWLRAEHPNLDAAFTHAHSHHLDHHIIALAAGLADLLLSDGPWTRALVIHQAAADAALRLDDPAAHAAALSDLGRMRSVVGDQAGAVETQLSALEISRRIGDHLGEANALNTFGLARYITGDLSAAAEAQTSALETYRRLGSHLGEANTLNNLGQVRNLTGDHAGAADAQLRALKIYRRLGNHLGEANAFADLGRVRHHAGEYAAAAEAQLQALEIYRRLGNRLGEANMLADVGRVRHLTGDYPAAADAHTRALDIYRRLGYRLGEANALNNLGRMRQLTGDLAAAADAQTQALDIFRRFGNRLGVANALADLGRVLHQTEDYPAAAEAHTQALEIYREFGHRGNEAYALNHYAATVAALGDRPRALELYHQALAMNRELHKPDDEALSLEGIGEHHLATGDLNQAVSHLRLALDVYQRLGMRADTERIQARLRPIARRISRSSGVGGKTAGSVPPDP